MDGTIADTDPMIFATMNILYDKYRGGVRTPKEKIYYFSGPPIRGTLKNEFPDLDPEFIFNEFYRISKEHYTKEFILAYPNCREVLLKLKEKGFRLGVVTNKVRDLAEVTLKVVMLDDVMEYLVGINDVKTPKPDKEGIMQAMNALGGDIKHTLYVGDNNMDLLSANNAGVDTLLVTWGPRKINVLDKAKFLAKSYNDIGGILL